jgi:hypothetical protein
VSLVSRRRPPHYGALLAGLAAGAVGGYALLTGRFPVPPASHSIRFPFVEEVRDPSLFHFWILVAASYFLGLAVVAFVRFDLIEARIAALPRIGRIGRNGRPRTHPAEALFCIVSLGILVVCYLLTLKS